MGDWGSAEIEELRKLYKENDNPSDQLVKDRAALDTFVATFNSRLGLEDAFTAEEVASQLFKLRKSGRLPRIRN
jgi:hypothetical protein